MKRFVLPLIFGLLGTAVLLSLGVWQVQRLNWKEGILAQIDARIGDAPVGLPATPTEAVDEYLPVTVPGTFQPDSLDVLISIREQGPGFRVIQTFQTEDERRILVDRGFLPEAQKADARPLGAVTITGNLLWPDEVDGFTPDPDMGRNMWFARDLPRMADALGAEPILIVQRDPSALDGPIRPFPVDSSGISNDHLQYAVTWFSLAAIWVLMTGYFLWRQRRPNQD